jgi:hypothetical protein
MGVGNLLEYLAKLLNFIMCILNTPYVRKPPCHSPSTTEFIKPIPSTPCVWDRERP